MLFTALYPILPLSSTKAIIQHEKTAQINKLSCFLTVNDFIPDALRNQSLNDAKKKTKHTLALSTSVHLVSVCRYLNQNLN